MELKGQHRIQAPRAAVWAALNDPEVLARSIDGVERLERVGDNRFEGVLDARVGPVRARFQGGVELTEVDAPRRYVLVGEGRGGVAGFAKGSAEVELTEADEGAATDLSYVAKSQVGGKLAQLGARLVEGAARGYAERFFQRFATEVEGAAPADGAVTPATAAAAAARGAALVEPSSPMAGATEDSLLGAEPLAAGGEAPVRGGLPPAVWVAALVIGILVLVWLLAGGRG